MDFHQVLEESFVSAANIAAPFWLGFYTHHPSKKRWSKLKPSVVPIYQWVKDGIPQMGSDLSIPPVNIYGFVLLSPNPNHQPFCRSHISHQLAYRDSSIGLKKKTHTSRRVSSPNSSSQGADSQPLIGFHDPGPHLELGQEPVHLIAE